MPLLIKGTRRSGGRIVEDHSVTVTSVEELAKAPATCQVIASLSLWSSQRHVLLARAIVAGVLLAPDDDARGLVGDVERINLIAVQFPSFMDGRGYSIARQLRGRLGYLGELRAVGDILPDQVFYLLRCGFDAMAPRADQNPARLLASFHDFRDVYQVSADEAIPLFRRRSLAAQTLHSSES